MAVQQPSDKCFVTVSEMADLCLLSRSHFYSLLSKGVFPKPVRHPSSKRPVYDRGLIDKCLEIKQTGVGANGLPALFNRKSRKGGTSRARPKPTVVPQPDHADLLDALKELGLTTTAPAVNEAVAASYPTGLVGADQGDVVRKVFLYLQTKKK